MIVQVTEVNMELLFQVSSLVDGPFDDESKVRRKILGFLRQEGCRAFIFVEDGVPLGYVGCKLHEEPPHPNFKTSVETFGHIAKIGVRKDARRNGIGKQLLFAGEQWIRSLGLPGVWLDYNISPKHMYRERFYREYKVVVRYTDTRKKRERRIVVKQW